jgi:hypothetical protein
MEGLSDEVIEKVLGALRGKLDPEELKRIELAMRGVDDREIGAEDDDMPENGITKFRRAEEETKGVLTAADCLACDSAEGIYKKALRRLGVDPSGIHGGAVTLRAVFRATQRSRTMGRTVAMDAASAQSLADRFPHAAKIRNNTGFMG